MKISSVRLTQSVVETEKRARELLSGLPLQIRFTVTAMSRDLTEVGGVTGRADSPHEVFVYLSSIFDGAGYRLRLKLDRQRRFFTNFII